MKTMRKMLLVASLVSATACGSVEDPGAMNGDPGAMDGAGSDAGASGSDAGTGTGAGSGSGSDSMDAGVPEQAGQLSIDSSDFIIENGVWWTTTSGPTLHGTFSGATGSVVGVKVGSAAPIVATLTVNDWAVALPSGSITSSNAPVVVSLTSPTGARVEVTKTLGLDSAPPAISVQASTIRDERGDTIDFSTGEPIHTHAGAAIDLGATGCPSVYKYAYLMDAAPTFGSATSPNDLAWRFRITDAKLQPGSQQFRVRTDAGATLVGWTALPAPDAAGYSTVKLTRTGGDVPIASLGTRSGQFFIDVRATDWGNLSTTSSFCFDNHPLAAPLNVLAFEKGALFDTSMNDDAAITQMLTGTPTQVVKQRIIQQTAEPIVVTWSTTSSVPAYTATKMDGYVEDTFGGNWFCQPGNTDPRCVMTTKPTLSAPAHEGTVNGTMQNATFKAVLRDDVTNQIVQTSSSTSISFTIPARAASESPHPYTVAVTQIGFYELMPNTGAGDFNTYSLMNLGYSGSVPWDIQGTQCVQMTQTAWGPVCQQAIKYWAFTALDRATIAYAPFVATITTGISAQTQSAASYVPASALTSAAFTWDSGDDDLPGPL